MFWACHGHIDVTCIGPLTGITVVALEQAVAAPFCTARMADAGARVIKVERAEGDFARGYDTAAKGLSSYFVWLNRGKESIALDLKKTEDLGLVKAIIAKADVFVQNLAPGAAERLGIGASDLCRDFPALITVGISGYGNEGEYASRKAYDLLIQAEAGLASVTGTPDGPGRVGVSVCDVACGMNAYTAVLEALMTRQSTGEGEAIEISLFDSLAEWMTVPLLNYEADGKEPPRLGLNHASIAPYGVYACTDGPLLIAIQNEREWVRLCAEVLGDPEVATDPRFSSNVARVAQREALDQIIEVALQSISRADAIAKLEKAKVAFASLNDMNGLSEHPVLKRIKADTPQGPVHYPAPPGASKGRQVSVVPSVDQHGPDIRREFEVRA